MIQSSWSIAGVKIEDWAKVSSVVYVRYIDVARRYNYTTAKSYLELIALFKSQLASKRAQLGANKSRLQSGVEKISEASAQVLGSPALLLTSLTSAQTCVLTRLMPLTLWVWFISILEILVSSPRRSK